MPGWGSGPWGDLPWGDDDATFALVAALAIRENVIRVAFNQRVFLNGLLDSFDASTPNKWSLTPDTSTMGSDGQVARLATVVRVELSDVDPINVGHYVDLTLDRPLTSHPAQYTLDVNAVYNEDLTEFIPGDTLSIPAVFKQIVPPSFDTAKQSRDIANPQSLGGTLLSGAPGLESLLGTLRTDSTGDYSFDQGSDQMRKRIIRRLITKKNAFAHLPGYGVGIPYLGKQLLVAARLAAVQADAQVQILQEPDVANATVKAIIDRQNPNIVRFQIFVTPKQGAPSNFEVPFNTAG